MLIFGEGYIIPLTRWEKCLDLLIGIAEQIIYINKKMH